MVEKLENPVHQPEVASDRAQHAIVAPADQAIYQQAAMRNVDANVLPVASVSEHHIDLAPTLEHRGASAGFADADDDFNHIDKKTFEFADKDKKGYVTRDDIDDALKALKTDPTRTQGLTDNEKSFINDDLKHMQKIFDRLQDEPGVSEKPDKGVSCDQVYHYNERNSPGSGSKCEIPTS